MLLSGRFLLFRVERVRSVLEKVFIVAVVEGTSDDIGKSVISVV